MKKEESSSSEEETSSEESEEEDEEEEKPVVKTPAATRTDSLLARSSQAREVASTPSTRSGYSSPSYKGSFDRDNSPKYGSSTSTTATPTPHRVRPTPMHTEPEENRYSGSR